MDDFFSAAPSCPSVSGAVDDVHSFAQAIAGRFHTTSLTAAAADDIHSFAQAIAGRSHTTSLPLLTAAAAAAADDDDRDPDRPLSAPMSPPKPSNSPFSTATALNLPHILATPDVLVLDIRPHSAFASARLPRALSLSVPSTLLKRPAFTLQKLGTMLSSTTACARFARWPDASRILVYDADTAVLHDAANVLGLLRKFRAEGFRGDIAWLQGGIQALWRDHRHLLDEAPLNAEDDADDADDADDDRFLRARDLPKSAFQQSTTSSVQPPAHKQTQKQKNRQQQKHPHLPLPLPPPTSTQRTAANPFYDNIRQNIELSQGITERIPLKLPPSVLDRVCELPFDWLRNIAGAADHEEGTEALAMQFYRVELGEQRRLQGVMAHHSQQNADAHPSKPFPFSITAGVEKGTKNRYRDIWPFEHARVRLQTSGQDDYVNASHVQPLGTKRKYIATQGPLSSTFTDFWTLVWEQDVRMIVMLTKEVEGAVTKCGHYWQQGPYGDLYLKLLSTTDALSAVARDTPTKFGATTIAHNGFDFYMATPAEGGNEDPEDDIIQRTFELTHAHFPDAPPRVVTQLQYVGWPDMNVPDSPRGLLRLIKQVDDVLGDDAEASPLLLHCSAGVGRTGGFIMIDAILDGVRREIRKRSERERLVRDSLHKAAAMEAVAGRVRRMSVDAATSGTSSRETAYASEMTESETPDRMDVDMPSSSLLQLLKPRPTSLPRFLQVAGGTTVLRVVKSGGSTSRPVSHANGPAAARHLLHLPVVRSAEKLAMSGIPEASSQASSEGMGSGSGSKSSSTAKNSDPFGTTPDLPVHGSGAAPSVYNKNSNAESAQLAPGSAFESMDVNSLPQPCAPANAGSAAVFTVADADSMFVTDPTARRAFAMDIEPHRCIDTETDLYTPREKERSKMSSSDEVPFGQWRGMSEDDSDSCLPQRSTSGSASAGAGSGGGGYSSSSSLGLRGFSGLSTSGVVAPPLSASLMHRRLSSSNRPSVVAPTPVSAMQAPIQETLSTAIGAQRSTSPTAACTMAKDSHSSSLENSPRASGSSSSQPSADAHQSLLSSSPNDESSATPLSIVTASDVELDTDVQSSDPTSKGLTRPRSTSLSVSGGEGEKGSGAFDYTRPRPLHRLHSPPALTSLQEPVRQVLEDMREQRMSLCQSLRQYVFVHRAIIEGVLEIVDEERRREIVDQFGASAKDGQDEQVGLGDDETARDGDNQEDDDVMDSTVATPYKMSATPLPDSPMKGKRTASPTELPKEGRKGEVMTPKRPSIKRHQSRGACSNRGEASQQYDAYPDS